MLLRTAERIKDFAASEIVLLIFAGVLALGAYGFIEIADDVLEGDTQKFDERIMRSLRTADDLRDPWGPAWLEQAAIDATALGSVAVLVLLTVATAAYLLLTRHYSRTLLVIAATIGGGILVGVLKDAFARPRPDIVPHLAVVHSMSFPSGHAAMSAAIYLTLGVLLAQAASQRRVKLFFTITAIVLTLLVGVSRVYLGVHYPTDVLAGWCIGVAWAAAVCLAGYAVRRYREHGRSNLGVLPKGQAG